MEGREEGFAEVGGGRKLIRWQRWQRPPLRCKTPTGRNHLFYIVLTAFAPPSLILNIYVADFSKSPVVTNVSK